MSNRQNLSKTTIMPRFSHYSPQIRRELVTVLYHERKTRGVPMTRLVDQLLTEALKGSQHWNLIEQPSAYNNQPGQKEPS